MKDPVEIYVESCHFKIKVYARKESRTLPGQAFQ